MDAAYFYPIFMFIVFLAILTLLIVMFYKDSNPSTCPTTGLWVKPLCVFVSENYADSTLPTPTQSIYLQSFTYDPNLSGGAICEPQWYAFRYVRISDGGYSALSNWTTIPVQSGTTNLPCYGSCQNIGISPTTNTCTFNRPTLATVAPLDLSFAQGYVLNLHRQSGTFDPNEDGDLVGFLIETNSPNQIFTSQWTDILFTTNPNGQICQGC